MPHHSPTRRVAWLVGRFLVVATAMGTATCARNDEPAACLVPGTGIDAVRLHMAQEEANGFSGAVAVEQGGERFLWASEGYSPDGTRFWLASISKSITATAAVRLADQGALDLDVTVRQLFPFVVGPVGGRTLKQLLAHRGGLGDHYAADGIVDREQAVRRIAANGVEHEGFSYSNDSYNLAAAMMEKATGKPFEALVRETVFEPLGMADSGFWGEKTDRDRFARLHISDLPGVATDGQPIRNYGYLGSTGVYSTARDMMAFLDGVQSDAFLAPAGRAKLWTPGWASNGNKLSRSGQSYGLGWGLTVENDVVVRASHGGFDTHLHNGEIALVPGGDSEIVVLAEKALDDDYTWSDRAMEGMRSCLDQSGG